MDLGHAVRVDVDGQLVAKEDELAERVEPIDRAQQPPQPVVRQLRELDERRAHIHGRRRARPAAPLSACRSRSEHARAQRTAQAHETHTVKMRRSSGQSRGDAEASCWVRESVRSFFFFVARRLRRRRRARRRCAARGLGDVVRLA